MLLLENDAELIHRITKLLNSNETENENYYIRVELMDKCSQEVVGSWCDEFGEDNWYFETKGK